MKYNVLEDHDSVFEIPSMYAGSHIWLGITSLGFEYDARETGWSRRERFAYTIATGPYDDDVQVQGDDFRGPAIGGVEPHEVVASLLGFFSAYAEGDLIDSRQDGGELFLEWDGEVIATGETAEFIKAHGEDFGIASSDLENGYLAYPDVPNATGFGLDIYVAEETGKEPE